MRNQPRKISFTHFVVVGDIHGLSLQTEKNGPDTQGEEGRKMVVSGPNHEYQLTGMFTWMREEEILNKEISMPFTWSKLTCFV